jgi:hypothetical protein
LSWNIIVTRHMLFLSTPLSKNIVGTRHILFLSTHFPIYLQFVWLLYDWITLQTF